MDIGQYYDFNTLAPTTLGLKYRGVKLIRTELLGDAVTSMDVVTVNASVSTETGVKIPYDVNSAKFYIFEVNGNEMVFSEHWIDNNSIVETSTKDIVVEINDINVTNIPVLEQMLAKMGLSFKINQ